jgi:hypothetical protein
MCSGSNCRDRTPTPGAEVRDRRREEAEERRRLRWSARRIERAEAVEAAWQLAEADTKGNLLNRRGREAGINERTLFTGPEKRARAYASEELLEHWETHPRPTAAMFEGRNTRVAAAGQYYGPRSRMSSEEAQWRDWIERDQTWPIEVGPHAEAAA